LNDCEQKLTLENERSRDESENNGAQRDRRCGACSKKEQAPQIRTQSFRDDGTFDHHPLLTEPETQVLVGRTGSAECGR
jgi:hypothetical protein